MHGYLHYLHANRPHVGRGWTIGAKYNILKHVMGKKCLTCLMANRVLDILFFTCVV